jgi:hypothetical protein
MKNLKKKIKKNVKTVKKSTTEPIKTKEKILVINKAKLISNEPKIVQKTLKTEVIKVKKILNNQIKKDEITEKPQEDNIDSSN